MGLLKLKVILSTTAILIVSEISYARYNADDHEARIRRSCNSLRDWEERMGCFNGDITMIEQIRRRQRAEMRRNGSSYNPGPSERKSRKVVRARPPVIESYPAPEIEYTPVEDQGATPQLIAQPAPAAPVAPSQDYLPGPQVPGTFVEAADRPIPDSAAQSTVAPSKNESTHAKGNPTQQQRPSVLPESLRPAPSTETQTQTPVPSQQKKEADTTAAAPAVPLKFPMTCAESHRDLEKKPHLRDAMARIMKTSPMKRGETREYSLNGWTMNPANCLGLFTRTLRNCNDQSTSDKTITRIDAQTGRIQAQIAEQWVSQKVCSDGEKVVSSASLTKRGFTFHFKTTVRQSKGKVLSTTTGYLENDPQYLVTFGENTILPYQDNSRMVASQGRAPRGRN